MVIATLNGPGVAIFLGQTDGTFGHVELEANRL
jgi:hypothetical protein